MKYTLKNLIIFLSTVPALAFAQQITFSSLVWDIIDLIGRVSIFVMTLAIVVFLWGMVRFVYSAGDSKANQDGKQIMLWGIIGLFTLFSVWGIIEILQVTFAV